MKRYLEKRWPLNPRCGNNSPSANQILHAPSRPQRTGQQAPCSTLATYHQNQRYKARKKEPARPKLPYNVITKSSRANLGDRQPASGDDQTLLQSANAIFFRPKPQSLSPKTASKLTLPTTTHPHWRIPPAACLSRPAHFYHRTAVPAFFTIGDTSLFKQYNEILLALLL